MHRQEREALWSHFELLEGRNNSFARDKEGADGTAGHHDHLKVNESPLERAKKNTFLCFKFFKNALLQAEAKYYCVDELVVGTEQSLGKLGVEVKTPF